MQKQEDKKQYDKEEEEEDDESESEEEEEDEDESEEMQSPPVKQVVQQKNQNAQKYQDDKKNPKLQVLNINQKKNNNEGGVCYTDRIGAHAGRSLSYLGPNIRPQAWINQKNLQIKFLEQENLNIKQQLKDQGETIKINKEMMRMLILDSRDMPEREKNIIEKMCEENEDLYKKQQQLVKERDDMSAHMLINQQVIEDLKSKEEEIVLQNEENVKLLQDKLEKKEYALQCCELKIYHYEKYLQRKALTEAEGRTLLFKFQQEDPKEQPVKISNVVEDNMNLKQELKEAFQEVNKLQKKIQELTDRIIELEDQLKNKVDILKQPDEGAEMSIFDQTNMSQANIEKDVNLDSLKRMEKYFPKEYQNRLEILLLDMEKQLKAVKKEKKFMKKENAILKESNDSNQFVIQKLNSALTKASARMKVLEDRLGESDPSMASKLGQQTQATVDINQICTPKNQQEAIPDLLKEALQDNDDKIIDQLTKQHYEKIIAKIEEGVDPDQFGNLSSIMINPNEISNAIYASNVLASAKAGAGQQHFNFAKEMELDEKLTKLH